MKASKWHVLVSGRGNISPIWWYHENLLCQTPYINTKHWPPSCPLGHRKAVTSHCRGDYQVLGFVSAPFSIIFRFHEVRETLIIWAEMHWIAPFSKTCPKQVLPWIIASERCKQCLPCAQIPTGVHCSVLDLSENPVNQDFWNEHPIEGRCFVFFLFFFWETKTTHSNGDMKQILPSVSCPLGWLL